MARERSTFIQKPKMNSKILDFIRDLARNSYTTVEEKRKSSERLFYSIVPSLKREKPSQPEPQE